MAEVRDLQRLAVVDHVQDASGHLVRDVTPLHVDGLDPQVVVQLVQNHLEAFIADLRVVVQRDSLQAGHDAVVRVVVAQGAVPTDAVAVDLLVSD